MESQKAHISSFSKQILADLIKQGYRGKELLKNLGIEGDYEGIGFCALGYKNKETPKVTPRKDNYIYYIR